MLRSLFTTFTVLILISISYVAWSRVFEVVPPSTVIATTEAAVTTSPTRSSQPSIRVIPAAVVQGEPLMIIVDGISATSSIKKITFAGTARQPFVYNSQVAAFAGTDLNQKIGEYPISVELATTKSRTPLTSKVTVIARPKISAPLGIPQQLGGNTVASQKKLVETLVDEAAVLRAVPSTPAILWKGAFVYPLKNPLIITDTYGYSRETGAYSIAHKGTDFRAKTGTKVYAINSGTVRLVRDFRDYGKTIVVDHGGGVQSLYLHLSKYNVKEGDPVEKGQQIALSGATGYANGAHLHISIKIGGLSIDPMKFMNLVGKQEKFTVL